MNSSDESKKGIKEGDQVLTINGFTPTPDNLWKMNYTLDVLRPQPALRVSLLSSTNDRKDLDVVASMHQVPPVRDLTGEGIWDYLREIEEQSHENGMRWVGTKDGVMILKFPEFV
jgi:hypothetical protein